MVSAAWGVAVPEGESPSKRDMLVSVGQGPLHVGHERGVLGVPAAGTHVQATQLRPSGVAGLCVKGLPLEKAHVGRREEGRNDKEREGRREGRK